MSADPNGTGGWTPVCRYLGRQSEAAFDELTGYSDGAWEQLAVVARVPPKVLRDKVLISSHRTMCHFQQRVLAVAAQLPWRLGQGDLLGNLRGLQTGPQPDS